MSLLSISILFINTDLIWPIVGSLMTIGLLFVYQRKNKRLKDDILTNRVKPGYIVSSNETGRMIIAKEMNGKFILEGIDHRGALKIISKDQLADSFWSEAHTNQFHADVMER